MTGSMMRNQALAVAFGVALMGASGGVAWADDATAPARSAAPSQEQMAQPPMSGSESDAQRQQLLNGPDPVINVSPYSELRDGAGEIVNPQTGTPLPWTVQPD
jgi:hypothetical protein